MQHVISEKTFYKYLKCPAWVYLDVHGSGQKPHHPLLEKLMQDGLIEEKEREILSDREDIAEVKATDLEEAFYQTVKFMRQGRQTIYHGVLVHKHYVGEPDVLERVEGRSKLGDYYYIAADLKRAFGLRDEYKFQGCFYAELLERLQGIKPAQGYVIAADKQVFAYLIEEFEAEYHLTLDGIERTIAGQEPPHFFTSGCKQSPWYAECQRQSAHCEDLSVLNRVWREEVRRLQGAGLQTIAELAGKSVKELEALVPAMSPDRIDVLHDQAVAMRDNRHLVRGELTLPQSNVELHLDVESDPLRDLDYLIGVLVVEGKREEYHSFLAMSAHEQEHMWKEFLNFFDSYHDAPLYHYGVFERQVFDRFIARFGASELAKEALEKNMVDLIALMRPVVIFPLPFYSLKDTASYVGFRWRSSDASGANSVLWFEDYLQTKDDMLLQKILQYNEDDCRATLALKKWLQEHV